MHKAIFIPKTVEFHSVKCVSGVPENLNIVHCTTDEYWIPKKCSELYNGLWRREPKSKETLWTQCYSTLPSHQKYYIYHFNLIAMLNWQRFQLILKFPGPKNQLAKTWFLAKLNIMANLWFVSICIWNYDNGAREYIILCTVMLINYVYTIIFTLTYSCTCTCNQRYIYIYINQSYS